MDAALRDRGGNKPESDRALDPARPSELQFAEIATSDPRHDTPWENKPQPGAAFEKRSIFIEGAAHDLWVAQATESRPAVVYADQKTLQLLALISFKAQGESEIGALERAQRTEAFVYHGGESSLDSQNFPVNSVILNKNPEGLTRADALAWGAVIRHEMAHAKGAGEVPAHVAQQEYLKRNAAVIRTFSPSEIAETIRDKGQEPTSQVSPSDVISPSISPVGGPRGVGPAYYSSAPTISAAQQADNLRELERREAQAAADRQAAAERAALEAARLEAANRAAQTSREQWLAQNMPPLVAYLAIPITRFFFGPPEVSSERDDSIKGIAGGGMSGGLGGGGQGRGGNQQGQQQQQKKK